MMKTDYVGATIWPITKGIEKRGFSGSGNYTSELRSTIGEPEGQEFPRQNDHGKTGRIGTVRCNRGKDRLYPLRSTK